MRAVKRLEDLARRVQNHETACGNDNNGDAITGLAR